MTTTSVPTTLHAHQPPAASIALTVGALGVVFGDIGTSPLYTLKTVLSLAGDKQGASVALGCLSLVIWTLIIVTTLKYVAIAMRIDNDGEGGILALMSLLSTKGQAAGAIVVAGLFGAALIYGDGAITPAISVLSALEGLNTAVPALKPYVMPATATILIGLFALQPFGTAKIGTAFGPVMVVWFITIGLLGLWGIVLNPAVLWAINPLYGLSYLVSGGWTSFSVLGGVFLCVTGAEALYADMGHFGAAPIRRAWSWLVFPSLVLNYAGQTALILQGKGGADNIFYLLCPSPLLVPLILLATVATIIASQSIITGAFSMTRQAIQLGWLPRLNIVQTSASGYGQIYVGAVNWMLMIVTVCLAIIFQKSDNLASAYGVAVSLTMLMTTALLFIAMREIWGWSLLRSGAITGGFLIVDLSFVVANFSKILDGGYIPLILGAMVFTIMRIWHRGVQVILRDMRTTLEPLPTFAARLDEAGLARVPGTAVFLTRMQEGVPPVMAWHIRHNRSLHTNVFVLTVRIRPVPWVDDASRLSTRRVAAGLWRGEADYGFMERPDVPAMLEAAQRLGCDLPFDDVTYYIGHETVVPRKTDRGLPRWQEPIFATLARNAVHGSDFLQLPDDQTVEIGRRVPV
jgi:KUP system potassium uptake protein